MKNKDEQQRILAVQRFRNGEKPESICASLDKSKAWLYKWLKRQEHHDNDELWSKDSSRRLKNCANRTPDEIEEIVKLVRLSLYKKEVFCDVQAILYRFPYRITAVFPKPLCLVGMRLPQRKSFLRKNTQSAICFWGQDWLVWQEIKQRPRRFDGALLLLICYLSEVLPNREGCVRNFFIDLIVFQIFLVILHVRHIRFIHFDAFFCSLIF